MVTSLRLELLPISLYGEILTSHHRAMCSYGSSSASFPHLTTSNLSPGRKTNSKHPSRLSSQHSQASNITTAQVEEQAEVQVAEGYTMTQFCDKMIDYFMKENPRTKDWRKLLVFRDEWKKYKENFYRRCQARADAETNSAQKKELVRLLTKVKRIDDEIESHTNLLKEIQENPTDLNAVVAKRRKDFTGEFFRHLKVLSETYDSLDDRDCKRKEFISN